MGMRLTMTWAGCFVLAALLAPIGWAADAPAAAGKGNAPSTECTEQQQADAKALIEKLDAAKDDEARLALLADYLQADPEKAVCLLATMRVQVPGRFAAYLRLVLSVLSGTPANEDLVRRLSELYADVLAAIATDIEPAAGPEAPTGFGTGGGPNGGENPSQLNGPVASPSEPSI